MFDIGFAELILVAIIGLIVIGPERLPETIKQIALHVGRLKRMYRGVRSDIEKEIGADEIRRQLQNEEVMQSIQASKAELDAMAERLNAENSLQNEIKQAAQSFETSYQSELKKEALKTPSDSSSTDSGNNKESS